MSQLRISIAQMDVKLANPRSNWTKVQQLTQQAKQQGGQFVIFPELWDAGFALKKAKEFASAGNAGLFSQLTALSKQQEIYITGSILEKRGLGVANCAPMVSPSRGIVGVYRKIHLFPLMQEDQYLTAGESPLNLDMPWGRTALAICYDMRFPELFRRYALEGSKLVIVPCQFPEPRLEHYRTMLRSRAIENGIYIVAVNRIGEDVDEESGAITRYFGHSCIIDPWGNYVFEAGASEGVYTASIELDMVDEVQSKITTLNDRRPETYGTY